MWLWMKALKQIRQQNQEIRHLTRISQILARRVLELEKELNCATGLIAGLREGQHLASGERGQDGTSKPAKGSTAFPFKSRSLRHAKR